MADWIKWVGGLEDRAEVVAIAQRLNLPPVHVAGCCCVLWLWGRQEGRVKGNRCHIRHATLESCDRQVAVQGFAAAMQAAEWLVVEDGGISFPRWNMHNSDSAKARAMATLRQAKCRHARVTLASRKTVTRPLPEESRVDKRREEKKESTGPIRHPVDLSKSDPVGGPGGTGPEFTSGPVAGPDRKGDGRAFVQTFTLRVAEALGLRGDRALSQSQALGAVGRRLVKLADRDALAERFIAAAGDKRADASLQKPVAAWQAEVERVLGGRE